MATNYNAAADDFADKQEMVEYAHAHSCKVTEHMTHGVECDPNKRAMSRQLYTRANPVVTNQDLKTYDHGKFQVGLANLPSQFNGLPVGELWVEYRVKLSKPKLFVTRGLEIDSDVFSTSGYVTPSAPLGTNSSGLLVGQQNNIGCAVSTNATGKITITFPASYTGNVEVRLTCSGTSAQSSTATGNMTIVTTGNISRIADMYGSVISGEPTSVVYSPEFDCTAFTVPASMKSSYVFILHLNIKQSSSGVDNILTLTPVTAVAGTSTGMLSISQYQTFGSPGNVKYINSSGVVTAPANV